MKTIVCVVCGDEANIPIVFGEPTPETAEPAERREIVLAGYPTAADRDAVECGTCGQRYLADGSTRDPIDEDTRHQRKRLAAFKRGQYMLFNPRIQSARDIADAINRMRQESMKKNG